MDKATAQKASMELRDPGPKPCYFCTHPTRGLAFISIAILTTQLTGVPSGIKPCCRKCRAANG